MGTGAIWTRWCFVIKPRNILYDFSLHSHVVPIDISLKTSAAVLANSWRRLAAVNFLLGCVGVTQVTRIFLYQRSLKDETIPEIAQKSAKDVADTTRGVVTDPEGAAKKAELN